MPISGNMDKTYHRQQKGTATEVATVANFSKEYKLNRPAIHHS